MSVMEEPLATPTTPKTSTPMPRTGQRLLCPCCTFGEEKARSTFVRAHGGLTASAFAERKCDDFSHRVAQEDQRLQHLQSSPEAFGFGGSWTWFNQERALRLSARARDSAEAELWPR